MKVLLLASLLALPLALPLTLSAQGIIVKADPVPREVLYQRGLRFARRIQPEIPTGVRLADSSTIRLVFEGKWYFQVTAGNHLTPLRRRPRRRDDLLTLTYRAALDFQEGRYAFDLQPQQAILPDGTAIRWPFSANSADQLAPDAQRTRTQLLQQLETLYPAERKRWTDSLHGVLLQED